MSVVNSTPLLMAPEGYQISRSVRLRSSASGNFSRTVGTPTNKDVWTISSWTKYSAGGKVFPIFSALSGGYYEFLEINAGGDFYWITRNSAGTIFKQYYAATGQRLFRDPSAWYHFVVRKTSALTLQFYVNGEEFTLTAQTVGSPSSSINTAATTHYLGYQAFNAEYADGYLTEVNFIDGQALTPSSFGETDAVTGVWKPKKYLGTYGANGFYLNFSDPSAATAAAIGKDSSGNGNNWTPNNISVTAGATYDSMVDVPTMWADGGNGRGNYCVANPLKRYTANFAISNGNLTLTDSTSVVVSGACSMSTGTSGKYYFECTMTAVASNTTGSGSNFVGVAPQSNIDAAIISAVGSYRSGNPIYNLAQVAQTAGATYTAGDVIGVAVDVTNGTVQFYKNNVAQGATPSFTFTAGTELFPYVSTDNVAGTKTFDFNFGQRPFAYTPPTGFKALNTQNLPEATIKKGNQYFDVVTRNGFGSSGGSISTTLDMTQGGLLWEKPRNSAGSSNYLWDSVRGINANSPYLISNSTAAEATTGNWVTSFNNGSISVDSDDWTAGVSVVDWIWKESIAAGFDIVTYTGTGANTTVAHSLGVKPSLIIIKPRSAANPWSVYHASVGATKYLLLNATDAAATNATFMNNTEPTSSVFSLGSGTYVNTNGVTHVAYLFSDVAGYSKFGSYTGNGSADGSFVYCGFRPKFVMIKRTDTATDWHIEDASRNAFNVTNNTLYPNTSSSEASGDTAVAFDFTSNGFKLRASHPTSNASGGTYIFAAFAENPFKNSLAR